jgi:hypothetical protein
MGDLVRLTGCAVTSKAPTLLSLALCACSGSDADPSSQPEPVVAEFSLVIRNIAAADALVTSDGAEVDVAFSPGVWAVDQAGFELIEIGAAASPGLEVFAESGSPADFLVEVRSHVENARTFGGDSSSSYGDQPILPGSQVEFGFRATEGEYFVMASMFGQSNDVLIVTAPGLSLFDESGRPFVGEIPVRYVDAGTEENEEPGGGPNQAPRQAAPDDGVPESDVITEFDREDRFGFVYPAIIDIVVLEVTAVTIIPPEE